MARVPWLAALACGPCCILVVYTTTRCHPLNISVLLSRHTPMQCSSIIAPRILNPASITPRPTPAVPHVSLSDALRSCNRTRFLSSVELLNSGVTVQRSRGCCSGMPSTFCLFLLYFQRSPHTIAVFSPSFHIPAQRPEITASTHPKPQPSRRQVKLSPPFEDDGQYPAALD